MGQLIATVAGGAIGFAIGGPLGAQIGMTLGGMIGSTLFGPTIKGPRLTDLKVTASTYGVAIPELYGTVRVGGNLIWSSGIKETTKKSGLGKGGPKQVNYSYDATFALGLCKGPIDDVLRIWADSKLIYDNSSNATRNLGSGTAVDFKFAEAGVKKKKSYKFRFYRGDEAQLPDSLIVADKGADSTSAHRGLCYLLFEKFNLTDFGNRIPQITVELTKKLTNNFPTITVTDTIGDPVPNITNKEWFPDWELGRLLTVDQSNGNRTDIIDLATMKPIFGMDQSLVSGGRHRYFQGEGIYAREFGTSNSRPMEFWSGLTLGLIGTLGIESGNLDGFYNPNTKQLAIGALGQVGFCPFNTPHGRAMHTLYIGWTRSVWAFIHGSTVPLFHTTAGFEPEFIMTGTDDGSNSEMIAWRAANNRLELEVWKIGHGALGENSDNSAGVPAWIPSTVFTRTSVNITPFAGENYTPTVVLYDPSDQTIFSVGRTGIGQVPCAFKYFIATNNYKFAVKNADMPVPMNRMNYSRLAGDTFGYGYQAYGQPSKMVEIDLQTGALVRVAAFDNEYGNSLYFGQQQQWDDVSSSLIVESLGAYRRIMFRSGAASTGIAGLVQDICLKTGVLTADDIDVSGLTSGTLVGYLIDRETTARDVLKQLGTGFLFDCFESDYKLKFKSRGNASVVNIPEDWIGRDSEGRVVKETLTQELEMPLRISVNFYDTTRDHQQGSQSAKRKAGPFPTMWTRKEDIIDLPITWTPTDAKQCAEKLLKMAWANRTSYSSSLPWRYLKYDPTDVVTVTLKDGTIFTMRLSEVTIGADFVVEMGAVSEKQTAYTSLATGNVSITDGQIISGDYPAFPLVINTPLLRDIDYDTAGHSVCYLSVGTNALKFNGAFLFMNDGIEYRSIGHISSDAITGFCQNALPKTTAYESTDETSVLFVRLTDPLATLESVTQDDMVTSYANSALVGEEIIHFRTASLQADGSWKLTGFLRARRGTNYAVGTHVSGERFVLLEETSLARFYRAAEDYTVFRQFKAVPDGTASEEADAYSANLTPRDIMPYTPESLTITDDGTAVTISMQRRSRVTAPIRDGFAYVPYKEGEKTSAKMTYKVWPGLGVGDTLTGATPAATGTISLFDANGDDIPAVVTFPLTTLAGATKFLFRVAEVGLVEGFPKWVEYERLGQARWNATEFY